MSLGHCGHCSWDVDKLPQGEVTGGAERGQSRTYKPMSRGREGTVKPGTGSIDEPEHPEP